MHARTTLSGTETMLNHFADVKRSLKDPWEFSADSDVKNFSAETLLGAIMLKGSDMQPLFTDPKRFYQMNKYWWDKWSPTFEKWCIVLEKEYEPLWDRDGFETIDDHTQETGTLDTATSDTEVMGDETSGSRSSTEVMDDDTTGNKTSKETMDDDTTYSSTSDSNSSTENKVSAFDASTYQPHDTSATNSHSSESGSGTDDRTTDYTEQTKGTDDRTTTFNENTSGTEDRTTTKNGSVDTDTTGEKTYEHQLHSWGNWGISQTVQKLKKQELDIQYWNIYEHISDIFLDEMCVRVY